MRFIIKSSLFAAALAFSLGLVAVLPGSALAAPLQSVVYDIPVPPDDSTIQPKYLLPKDDGSVWFTSTGKSNKHPWNNATRINILKPDGSVTWKYEYTEYYMSYGRMVDFGARTCISGGYQMLSMGTSSAPTYYQFPSANTSGVDYVAEGSDGACWYAASYNGRIGRIASDGTVTEYPVGTRGVTYPTTLVEGSDGGMWFTENGAARIGRVDMSTGQISHFDLPIADARPNYIARDNADGFWFASRSNTSGVTKIGHITTAGTIVEYDLPAPFTGVGDLVADAAGNAWFTPINSVPAGSIGKITIDGQTSVVPIDKDLNPYNLRFSDDGSIWATLKNTNNQIAPQIARLFTAPTVLTAATSGPYQTEPKLNWTYVQGATSYNVYRDGLPVDSTTEVSYTDTSAVDGAHSYFVTSLDGNGQTQTGNTLSVYADSTSPVVTLTPNRTMNANGWFNQPVLITQTCSDPVSPEGTPGSGILTCTPGNQYYANDGTYELTAKAVDKAGNVTTKTMTIRLDKTAPTITFTAESNSWTNGTNVEYQCVDSGVTTTNTATIVTNPDGTSTAVGTCTDSAGNTSTTSIPVQVDTSAPQTNYTVSGPGSTPPNELGWSRGPVTVTFECSDPGGAQASGIASCSDPVTVTDEGTTVVTGTAVDNAGNITEVNVTVKIDSVAPEITASADQLPDSNGWYSGDVTVSFTCSDETSGVATCPDPVVVSGGGEHIVNGTAIDAAGNTASASITINIDAIAPTIDFTLNPEPNTEGWNTGAVTVNFTCTDTNLLSCSGPTTVNSEGTTVVTGTAVDAAGNTAEINAFVNIDSTEPELIAVVSPTQNSAGWNNTDATVTFSCSDATSGVATCPDPVTVTADGTQSVSGTATDVAGNSKTVSVQVDIDKTAPTIDYTLSPVPNGLGWNSGDVLVTFTCADATSGVDSCTSPVTVSAEGSTGVTGVAVDAAGNATEVLVFVNVDETDPTISPNFSSTNPQVNGWYTSDVTTDFTCDDTLSGVQSCVSSEAAPLTTDGRYTVTGTATDNADNSVTTTETVNLDKTAPILGIPGWTTNPLPAGGSTTIDVPAVDATSGIAQAEFFVGDTDPGVGNATPMTIANPWVDADGAVTSANLVATFGDTLQPGIYPITVRAQDVAGNWQLEVVDNLVVFDATGPTDVAMSKKAVPKLAHGDVLPGLLSDSQNGQADLAFDVAYTTTGSIDSLSNLTLDYANKQGCKNIKPGCVVTSFTASTVSPEAISWLTINGDGSSVGTFQGVGTLAVETDQGVTTTTNPFKVTATDGNRTTPVSSDTAVLYIYATGANPATATPLYQYHVSANGNWMKIQ